MGIEARFVPRLWKWIAEVDGMQEVMEQVLAHLEFLGYQITREGDLARCNHGTNWNAVIKPYQTGLLFLTFFGGGAVSKSNRAGFLEFVNHLNSEAAVSRFYVDSDGDLAAESWIPAHYDRQQFGHYLTLRERDIDRAAQGDGKRYLS